LIPQYWNYIRITQNKLDYFLLKYEHSCLTQGVMELQWLRLELRQTYKNSFADKEEYTSFRNYGIGAEDGLNGLLTGLSESFAYSLGILDPTLSATRA